MFSSLLAGTAKRHAGQDEVDVEAATAALHAIPAAGPEKMAEAAGLMLGSDWGLDLTTNKIAYALLIAAGADISQLRHWLRIGADNYRHSGHFSPT